MMNTHHLGWFESVLGVNTVRSALSQVSPVTLHVARCKTLSPSEPRVFICGNRLPSDSPKGCERSVRWHVWMCFVHNKRRSIAPFQSIPRIFRFELPTAFHPVSNGCLPSISHYHVQNQFLIFHPQQVLLSLPHYSLLHSLMILSYPSSLISSPPASPSRCLESTLLFPPPLHPLQFEPPRPHLSPTAIAP